MAKNKARSQEDQDIDVAFAALLQKFITDPRLVRRVPTTFFVFKVGDNYTFRFAPAVRTPAYINGIVLVMGFKIDKEAQTVTLGEMEMERVDGVLVQGLREASNAFGGLAIAMYRSIELMKAQFAADQAAQQEAAKAAATPPAEDVRPLPDAAPQASPPGDTTEPVQP